MKLILISFETFFEGEVQVVTSILRKHEIVFHLRKPGASNAEYRDFLQVVPEELHGKIMLHDAYELEREYQLKGLHFSTANRAEAVKYPEVCKSTSTHSVQEAKELDGQFDYMFISPVYPSISKQGYTGTLNWEEMEGLLGQPGKTQVMALGGVEASKLEELGKAGFDGFAVLGAVWGNSPETSTGIEQRLKRIYAEVKRQGQKNIDV